MPKRVTQYSFPILNVGAIVDCMAELNIQVTKEELKSPTEERMRYIYSEVFRNLMSPGDNGMDGKHLLTNLRSLEFPELHEQSFATVVLAKNLIKRMPRFGVKDFNLSDIIACNPERTARNLSALINFAKFRQTQSETYANFKDKQVQCQKNFEKQRKENRELGEKFAFQQRCVEDSQAECDNIRKEINALESQIAASVVLAINLKKEVKDIKKEQKMTEQHIKEKAICGQKLHEEICQVERQIVKSPQKIEEKIRKRTSKLQQYRQELQEGSNLLKMYEDRMDEYNEIWKIHENILRDLKQTTETYQSLINLHEEGSSSKQDLEQKRREYDRMLKETESIVCEMQRINDSLSQTRQKFHSRSEYFHQAHTAALKKRDQFLSEKILQNQTVTNLERKLKTAEEENQAKIVQVERQVQQIFFKVETLEKDYSDFCTDILTRLNQL